MATQQGWAFRVGDGGAPVDFAQINGLFEMPDMSFVQRTIRDDTDIAHAQTSDMKKYVFNKQVDGQEFTLAFDNLANDPAQIRLKAAVGLDAGVRVQYEWTDGVNLHTWEFTVLVFGETQNSSASNDDSAKDMLSYTLKMHDQMPTAVVA